MANLAPKDTWNPHILGEHPLFWPLRSDACSFVESFTRWPNLSDYQRFLDNALKPVQVNSGKTLKVVAQDLHQHSFEDSYEPRIFLKGELQTRQQSWHDFFQVLIWKLLPITKAALNELHYNAIKSRLETTPACNQRTVLENALTQYDECGAIIVSTNHELLERIRSFDWYSLFWEMRKQVEQQLKCIVFGHAIYEKGINPYIGITCHSVLIHVPPSIFNSPTEKLLSYLDPLVEKQFTNSLIQSPQDLSPFPVLGMPGWHRDNFQESFYHNVNYFRPGRKPKN